MRAPRTSAAGRERWLLSRRARRGQQKNVIYLIHLQATHDSFQSGNLNKDCVEATRKAIRGWSGVGQYDNVTASSLQRYIREKPALWPKQGKNKDLLRFQTEAILFGVAELIRERQNELNAALHEHTDTPFEEVVSAVS